MVEVPSLDCCNYMLQKEILYMYLNFYMHLECLLKYRMLKKIA